jgi:hypothetical protein
MLFKNRKDVPPEVAAAGLGKWYAKLDDRDRVRLGRYLKAADTSSARAFIASVMDAALEDENAVTAVTVGEAADEAGLSGISLYDVNERLIEAYFGAGRYDDCLAACDRGLRLFGEHRDEIVGRAGGTVPKDMMCRNYRINVLVGIMYDYDAGDAALREYFDDGLITADELEHRLNSNRIFRLQKTFDGIYAVTYKDE